MATIVEELVIQLGLDVTKFKRKQKGVGEWLDSIRKKSEQNSKSFEEQAGKAAQSFSRIKNELLSLLGIFMAGKGVKDFFTSITGSGQRLGQMSRAIGMSASELDRWGKTIDKAGGDGKAFQQNLASLSSQFRDAKVFGGPMPDQLNNISQLLGTVGKQITVNADDTINWGKTLGDVADAARANPLIARQTLARAGLDTGAIELFLKGSKEVARARAAVKPLTDKQIADEEALALKLAELGQKAKHVGEKFMVSLKPAIEKVLEWLEKLVDYFDAHPDMFAAIAVSATALVTLISGSWLAGMLGSLTRVGAGVAGLTGSFVALSRAAALAGAAYAGWEIGTAIREQLDKTERGKQINKAIGDVGYQALQWRDGPFSIVGTVLRDVGLLHDPEDRVKKSEQLKRRNFSPEEQKKLAEMDADFKRGGTGSGQPAAPASAATAAAPQTSAATGAYKPLLDLIGAAEGTDKGRGYNETLGYGAYTGGAVNLTGMTLREVDELQGKMLANPSNTWHSSAVGRYQITRTTLRDLMGKLGLTGNELFDASMQDRLAVELIKARGATQNGLSGIWASIPRSDTGVSAYGQRTGASSAQVQQAMEQAQKMLRSMPQPGAQMAMNARGYTTATTNNNNQSEVTINGPINIQTRATDADGIARGMKQALQNNSLINQANTGLA